MAAPSQFPLSFTFFSIHIPIIEYKLVIGSKSDFSNLKQNLVILYLFCRRHYGLSNRVFVYVIVVLNVLLFKLEIGKGGRNVYTDMCVDLEIKHENGGVGGRLGAEVCPLKLQWEIRILLMRLQGHSRKPRMRVVFRIRYMRI